MSLPECLLVLVAGAFAGTINTVVGSGTLVTFPVLLAVGYSPVVANVSNTLGLVPGSVSGAIGYREELAGQRKRVLTLGSASVLGGIVGAILLLSLPPDAFEAIVPVLIALALVLVIAAAAAQPDARRAARAGPPARRPAAVDGRLRHRDLRRLLRRGAGRDPARAHRDRDPRGPAAAERAQERARRRWSTASRR